MLRKLLTLLITFQFFHFSFAQQVRPCGATDAWQAEMANSPEYQEQNALLEAHTHDFVKKHKKNKSAPNKIIPVVVHIVHEGGIENVSDANVHDAIRIMNEDYQKINADTSDIIPAFAGIIGDADFEFRLAKIDPNGNCTNGITRIYDPTFTNNGGCANGGPCNLARPLNWPRDKYLNVWVVKDIASGAGAYSFVPGVPAFLDGIVCRYTQFGSLPPSIQANGAIRTMTHEVGHYLNLLHTWGPSNNSGLPSNCNVDDGVGDTPNTVGNSSGCLLNSSSCGSLDNIQNFMDYADCEKMFTVGQVARMEAAMQSGISSRNNLWSQSNLMATGTDDAMFSNPNPCAPIAEFRATETRTCSGSEVLFRDQSYNASYDSTWTYQWSFPGGNPATSTDRFPTVIYNSPGNYDVSLQVSNAVGSSAIETKTSYVTILQGSGSLIAPYVEDVSNTSWPGNSDASLEWEVNKPSGSLFGFQRTTNAFFSPPASIYLNNFGYNGTDIHELISPTMDLSALSPGAAFLNFQSAYSRKANENEILILYSSINCGDSWKLEKIFLPSEFISVPNANSSSFVPANPSEWRFVSYDVSSLAGNPNVMFSFRFDASNGNNLFLDDIAVSDISAPVQLDEGLYSSQFHIYPNPGKGQFNLEVFHNESEMVIIELSDLNGKVLKSEKIQIQSGMNKLNFDYNRKPGIYLIHMTSKSGKFSKKILIE